MQIKRKWTLLFAIIIGITTGSFFTSNAATFNDINSSDVFIKQSQKDTCTLAAATMLVRRAAMATGNTNWRSITEASMKPIVWTTSGLLWNFSYAGISVSCLRLPGGSSNASTLIDLLSNHPEGIVIYDYNIPHAILLTDYTGGTFYCADPSNYIASGRIPISSASVAISDVESYWYVKSPKVSISNDTIKPTITNAKVTNITKDGYTVTCSVSDNVGVTKVSMPTWTISNGQDDLIWHTATINGNTATCTVKRTDHKNEGGTYVTDIYADDAAGNSSTVRVSATLPNQLPTGKITSVEPYEYGYFFSYSGTATDVDDESQSVKIEVYKVEESGSETLLGTANTNASKHTFASYIYPEVHGNQIIRIYAIDVQTGDKVLLGTKSFYLKKGIKSIIVPSDTIDVECGKSTTIMINTDPMDADEPLELGGGKSFVEASLNGKKLTIKGLSEGSTWIRVIGSWGSKSSVITINISGGHKYVTIVEKEATCNAPGLSYEQCSICGEKKAGSEKTIPATGKHVKDTSNPPGVGWHHYGNCVYADVNTYKCAVCGTTIEEIGKKYTQHKMYIQVVGREATCGEEGYYCKKCAICGIEEPNSRIAIPATGKHTYVTDIEQEPTCSNVGFTCERCSVCGAKKSGSEKEIPPTGEHRFGNWVQTKQPTTTNDGLKTRSCSICGKTETVLIAKLISSQSNIKDDTTKTSGGAGPDKLEATSSKLETTPGNLETTPSELETTPSKQESSSSAKLITSQADTQSDVMRMSETGELSKAIKTLKIKLNTKKRVTLVKGQELRIKVKGITKKKVTFKSSNRKVATITAEGIVKGKKGGKATITVKCGKKKAKITIKVKK